MTTLTTSNSKTPLVIFPSATSLGTPLRTYGQTASYKRSLLASPIFLGILALAGLFVLRPMLLNGLGPFASLSTFSNRASFAQITLILPAVLGLATLYQLVRLRLQWGTTITIYQHGLAFRQGPRKAQTWLWEDVRGLREQIIRHTAYGVVTVATTFQYWLVNQNGHLLALDQNTQNLHELVQEIRHALRPILFNKAAEAYRHGQSFGFGVVEMSPAGLVCQKKMFAWEQIAEIQVSNGRLLISPKKGGFFSHGSVDTAQIENLEVLLELIHKVKEAQTA